MIYYAAQGTTSNDRNEFKEKASRQNFTIQPIKLMENSPIKRIGEAVSSPIKNQIDIDDLKRSHNPLGQIKEEDIGEKLAAKFNFTVQPQWKKDDTRPNLGFL